MYPRRRYVVLTALVCLLLATECIKKVKLTPTRSHSVNTPPIVVIANDTLPTPCDIAGPVISRAKNFVGTVLYYGHPEYHGNTGLYCIIHSIPNTSGNQKFGYVCNMPDKFKQKGLEVIFSGEYYHAYKDIKPTGHDGQALMYLRLESIRAL